MKPIILGTASQDDVVLYIKIRNFLDSIPGEELPKDVSCHTVCYALAELFPVQVVDGFFRPSFRHSWLLLPSGFIIDPYLPFAYEHCIMINPIENTGSYSNPWHGFYIAEDLGLQDDMIFQKQLKETRKVFRHHKQHQKK